MPLDEKSPKIKAVLICLLFLLSSVCLSGCKAKRKKITDASWALVNTAIFKALNLIYFKSDPELHAETRLPLSVL